MATKSTRNKIRHQSAEALANMRKCQNNLAQLAALADERSTFINEYLPSIMATVETLVHTLQQFDERL